jgi:hypothetical protein
MFTIRYCWPRSRGIQRQRSIASSISWTRSSIGTFIATSTAGPTTPSTSSP